MLNLHRWGLHRLELKCDSVYEHAAKRFITQPAFPPPRACWRAKKMPLVFMFSGLIHLDMSVSVAGAGGQVWTVDPEHYEICSSRKCTTRSVYISCKIIWLAFCNICNAFHSWKSTSVVLCEVFEIIVIVCSWMATETKSLMLREVLGKVQAGRTELKGFGSCITLRYSSTLMSSATEL